MRNTQSIDTPENQLIKFIDPDPGLIGWHGGCGKIECTQLRNVMISDLSGDFLGETG